MLTRPDVAKAVARLVAAFGPPFGNDPEAVTREWHRTLERQGNASDLDAATSDVIATAVKWPTVAQIRAALDSRRRARYASGSSPAAPDGWPTCGTCRGQYYYAGFELADGRVVGRMRCRCAKSAASHGWRTPGARAWVDSDPRLAKWASGELADPRMSGDAGAALAAMAASVGQDVPGDTDPAVVAAREAKRAALLRSLGEHEEAA